MWDRTPHLWAQCTYFSCRINERNQRHRSEWAQRPSSAVRLREVGVAQFYTDQRRLLIYEAHQRWCQRGGRSDGSWRAGIDDEKEGLGSQRWVSSPWINTIINNNNNSFNSIGSHSSISTMSPWFRSITAGYSCSSNFKLIAEQTSTLFTKSSISATNENSCLTLKVT